MTPRRGDMVVTRWGARFRGRHFPCAIGRGGLTHDKREGDGASPVGVWRVVGATYRADRITRPAITAFRLRTIGPGDIWSDDQTDPAYNHGFHAPNHPFGHERLRRADPLYDLVLFTDWNWPDAVPGRGSAIFIHAWRRPRYPTAGCLAFAPADLRWISTRLTPATRIILRS